MNMICDNCHNRLGCSRSSGSTDSCRAYTTHFELLVQEEESNKGFNRREIATRLLVGIISRGEGFIANELHQDRSIDTAIEMADKLIKQLEPKATK